MLVLGNTKVALMGQQRGIRIQEIECTLAETLAPASLRAGYLQVLGAGRAFAAMHADEMGSPEVRLP